MSFDGFSGIMLAVVAVGALVFFIVVWAGMGVTKAKEDMNTRLAVYGRQTGIGSVRDDELSKPLAQRTVGPIVLRLSAFLRRFTPIGYLEKIDHKLVLAGSPANLDAPSFVVVKFLLTGVGLIAGFFLIDFGNSTIQRIVLFALPIALGFFAPNAWLERRSTTVATRCCGRYRMSWTCWSSQWRQVSASTLLWRGWFRRFRDRSPRSSSGCFRRPGSVSPVARRCGTSWTAPTSMSSVRSSWP